MRIPEIHQYDTYVPILADLQSHYTWQRGGGTGVDRLGTAGQPILAHFGRGAPRGGWCDRYENQGKRSGAFSAGSYDGDPYILMNYQPEVLDHVFTLAHEAGHSMHSHLLGPAPAVCLLQLCDLRGRGRQHLQRATTQPAPVRRGHDDRRRAYLINRQIDAMRGTIYRQTMFAEFESRTHVSGRDKTSR